MKFYAFERMADAGSPAGITITKRATLPKGDFRLTEYIWGEVSLWFVDRDKFTAAEREAVYQHLKGE